VSVAALLARAGAWLVEPAEEEARAELAAPTRVRPVVTVFGLGPRCGTTIVARALAAELAARDAAGAAAICETPASSAPEGARSRRGGIVSIGSPGAGRLSRVLQDVPGTRVRTAGRLCLVHGADFLALADTARHHAPIVLDAGGVAIGGTPAALADHVVLVAHPRLQPALAPVASACLARVGPEPVVVLNQSHPSERWAGRTQLELPESRIGAQLALAGREPPGDLGRAVAELADLLEKP
jgi:hypothetical protein